MKNVKLIAISAFVSLAMLSANASAQQMINQTRAIPGAAPMGTHADAVRVLGAPAAHSGNQGFPVRDSFQGYNANNQRFDGIQYYGDYVPGRTNNYQQRNYNTQYYNPPQYQFNQQQFQQNLQNLGNAIRQMRQQRQNNWNNGYYRQW